MKGVIPLTIEQRLRKIEIQIDNINRSMANLATRQGNRDSANESNISSVDGKASANENRIAEAEDNIVMHEETIDFMTSEILPTQNESIADVTDTVDYILTEILPTKADIE